VRARTLGQRAARRLAKESEAQQPAAARAFERARALRETIHRVFRAHALKEQPDANDLALLARSYASALEHAKLTRADSARGYVWTFDEAAASFDLPSWPLALSAVDLLESDELEHVRECGGRGCGWLFLDETRNHGRRWCVATACGNRERVRRYYARRAVA
jgi:predicted RNA-binding Zn ribbon-like protein